MQLRLSVCLLNWSNNRRTDENEKGTDGYGLTMGLSWGLVVDGVVAGVGWSVSGRHMLTLC